MQTLAILNGFIHLMATAFVLGGSFVLKAVVDKATKDLPPPERGRLNETIGKGFSMIAWAAIAVLLLSGIARSIGLQLLNTDVLFGTFYGNLLLGKIVLFAIIIVNSIILTRTAIKMSSLAAQSPPQMDVMQQYDARVKKLSMANLVIGIIVVFLAVAMRVIGAPI